MGDSPADRVVYSTEKGKTCPRCGWPAADCRCAATLAERDEPVPEKVTTKLRIEHRASGKSVTILDGLPRNRHYLEDLCRNLKKACGTGGSAGADFIELQGDQRERLRELLPRKGLQVEA